MKRSENMVLRGETRLFLSILLAIIFSVFVAANAFAAPFAYITNMAGNTVSVIDIATNTVVATIPVGTWPQGVAVNPPGTRVYVTNFSSNNVSVIDTSTNTVVAVIPVGSGPTAWDKFIGPGANSAPVANAGADQSVYVGDTVTLDGSGSTDADGNLLTYSWAFTSIPIGSGATLSSSTSVNPTFTVDKAGTYVISLIVNDGTVNSAADTVTISTLNSAPVANAGADQTAYVTNTVTLDGSGSYDVDGNLLTYSWAFTTVPAGSGAALSSSTSVNPTFTVDKAGTYVISLIVNDGTVNSVADTVTISTLNSAPVANAGLDQSKYVGDTVTLDGSGSSDVDGNALTYSWSFTSRPSGSTAALSGATSANPTFTADKAGAYMVSLIVNDGTVNSSPDTVTITANEAPEEEIEVEVSIKPETINLKSKGKFKAFIELPEPYSADEVVLATVVCEGAHAIEGRFDDDNRYIATFNTQDLRITANSKKDKKEEEVTLRCPERWRTARNSQAVIR